MNGPPGEQPEDVAEQRLPGHPYSFQQLQVQRRQQLRQQPNSDTATGDIPTFARHIHCFRLEQPLQETSLGKPKRARLTDQAKEKVLGVRRQGACLRCRMLKIECSLENPCQACLSSALKGTERKVLSWSYCIRTRFADVDIFQFQSPSSSTKGPSIKMRTETLMLKMGTLLGRIAQPAQFANLDDSSFNQNITRWLLDEAYTLPELQGGSMVAGMCANLLGLSFASTEDGTKKEKEMEELTHDFRRFLMAASVGYSNFESKLAGMVTREEAWMAGRVSGSRMLLALDRMLTPQCLAKLSRESCQVLFLVVLGAVLGVGYSIRGMGREMQRQSEVVDMQVDDWEFQQSPTLWLAMRDHLCQMLAHHLIYLGGLLGIKMDTGMEKRVIEWAGKGWGRISPEAGGGQTKGAYVWGHGILTPPSEEMQGIDVGRKMLDSNPAYWDDPTPRAERPFEPPPPLVAVPFDPELSQFQDESMYNWDQNPTSYLEMDMPSAEPESYHDQQPQPAHQQRLFAPAQSSRDVENKLGFPLRATTEPCYKTQGFELPRGIKKRRTMWIVRSVDIGPEYGRINVHARLRGHGRSGRADFANLETLTGFV
ncbi:hypothetical protein QBC36DRAFT_290599 [Triangularia setosa]|uniref:Zn(2)-C6 fungal-type domain-containing protein n=1 Tax=Triangularia setosa TaxID=2587417 RepID=A0AAN6W942_9PEZI|nr:hypothetical protein QBC36DRAFT_290599 [Podospora setosa]